jgi:hypothetical protein
MGMIQITRQNKGSDRSYDYYQLTVVLSPEQHSTLITDLLSIPKSEFKTEIVRRLESGTMREQLKSVLSEILGSSEIVLPPVTKENAMSALQSLGGLF